MVEFDFGTATMARADNGALHGHVERIVNCVMEGWTMDVNHPTTPISLELFIGAIGVGSIIAGQYRFAFDDTRRGDGCCGFRVPLVPQGHIAPRRQGY